MASENGTTPELSPEILAKYTAYVDCGALYFDATMPAWWTSIDKNRLDLADGGGCILGQLYGEFSDGLDARRWTLADAAQHGLYLRWLTGEDAMTYATLTALWLEEINKREIADQTQEV